MNVKYVNPFISSVMNTMEMMVGMTPERQTPYVKDNILTQGDITGIIGFAESKVTGSIALSFPQETALEVYKMMTGETAHNLNSNVQNMIGELANIIAGGAKTTLAEEGLTFHVSIPSVIVGKNHKVSHNLNVPAVVIPFTMGNFSFLVEVSIELKDR
ncbi:MAG: chemotaxis protein CheX [Candidatus Electryonea clarkiae]|nr:chemotaxis protein CheX [Candidatus Electryonea clarkiae]MDP8286849.1 chemotaxis protein CheX [Candidatus Electryonea clarkiae]